MKRKNTETVNKYLAGLLDADGSLSFQFHTGYDRPRLVLKLSQSSVTARGKGVEVLRQLCHEHYQIGYIRVESNTNGGNSSAVWRVTKLKDIETLFNHVLKHMIIKPRHWQRMLAIVKAPPRKRASVLHRWSKLSRRDTGPLKPKNFASLGWVAGFIDGDGCLTYNPKKMFAFQACGHMIDSPAANYLSQYWNTDWIIKHESQPHLWKMYVNLGKSNRPKLDKLRALVPHLRMKRWNAEQILAYHSSRND